MARKTKVKYHWRHKPKGGLTSVIEHFRKLKPNLNIKVDEKAAKHRSTQFVNKDIPFMTTDAIRQSINQILFKPEKGQTEKEVMHIVILKDKAEHFDFLMGYTMDEVTGRWKNEANAKVYDNESNYEFVIEYKDDEKGNTGHRLLELLDEYNHRVIQEDLLYVRSEKVDESSL